MSKTKQRSLHEIAVEIKKDWGAKLSPYAKPWVDAMICLESISDMYGCDTGKSVVAYFLCNASAWRGEVARRVKKELNAMIK